MFREAALTFCIAIAFGVGFWDAGGDQTARFESKICQNAEAQWLSDPHFLSDDTCSIPLLRPVDKG